MNSAWDQEKKKQTRSAVIERGKRFQSKRGKFQGIYPRSWSKSAGEDQEFF